MRLNAFVAQLRTELFEDLKSNRAPRTGTFDAEQLQNLRSKGTPQLGSVRYTPDRLELEFIYPDPGQGSSVFTVGVETPERIVYLGVPAWVVENIWEGEVSGSYAFASEAAELMAAFAATTEEAANLELFGRRDPTRRQ